MHATACLAAKNNCLAAKNKCLAESNRTRTESKATNKRLHPRSSPTTPKCRSGPRQAIAALARSHFGNPNESPRPYMQPTDLKAIARDAALRGDTKTLFHTLDLLERVYQSPPSWTFAPNLRNSACKGRAHGRTETLPVSPKLTRWRVAPPGWVTAGHPTGIGRGGEGRQTKAPPRGAGLGGSIFVAITGLPISPKRSKPTTPTPSRSVGCALRGGPARKSPAAAGLSRVHRGLAAAITANPPRQYHSRLHSAGEKCASRDAYLAPGGPETNRDPRRAVIPLAKGSRFGPTHDARKSPAEAGQRSTEWACRCDNGKPIETIPRLVAQRARDTEKAPPGSGAKWVTILLANRACRLREEFSKPTTSTPNRKVGCTPRGGRSHEKTPPKRG